MQITPTTKNKNPNFTSRIFLKVPTESVAKLKEEVLPSYQYLLNKDIAILDITNLERKQRNFITEIYADKMGYSKSWLEANAKNHGFNPNPPQETNDIFILTGKDIQKVKTYIKKESSNRLTLFKLLFQSFDLLQESKKYPKYLQDYILDQSRFSKNIFRIYKFIRNDKNYKETENMYSLLLDLLVDKK